MRLFPIAVLCCLTLVAGAQSGTPITAAELKKHVAVLASDSLQGRETGKPGQKMAAAYISSWFRQCGLQPPFTNDEGQADFLQHFSLYQVSSARASLAIGGQPLQIGKDYVTSNPAVDSVVLASQRILYLGHQNPAPGQDVKGKAVLLIEAKGDEPQANLTISRRMPGRIEAALKAGAAVVMCASPFVSDFATQAERRWSRVRYGALSEHKPSHGQAVVWIDLKHANALLGLKEGAAEEAYKTAKLSKKAPKLSVDIANKVEVMATENVGGLLPGTGPKADELLVLSAHYDHLGIRDGQVYNGADDDGSGTAAVMELAHHFAERAKAGKPQARSMLFICFTGEEKGLLGSDYYTTHPIVPMAKTVADLNIDMIGRVDPEHGSPGQEGYTYVIGPDKINKRLDTLLHQANTACCKLELNYTYNDEAHPERLYYRSDHYNFARNGVPVCFFFTGLHADYHKPTDDIDKLDFAKMARIATLVETLSLDINKE